MLALTDHSKLLNSAAAKDKDRQLAQQLGLAETLTAHGALHDRVIQLSSQLAQDLNSDFAAVFNEKKYKEIQALTQQAQFFQV
jgi:hypothetical protein